MPTKRLFRSGRRRSRRDTRCFFSLHTDSEPNREWWPARAGIDAVGIESRPLWKPMHLQPVYKNNPRYVNGVSESLFKQGLCLPSGPCVTDEDVAYIVQEIKNSVKK
ncbi:MAG: DegT/DnrJ/EryC1/StrS family aminotransferase [Parabacteroides merdae]